MKEIIVSKMLLAAMILGLAGYVNADTSTQSEEAIKAQCEAESKNADYPKEYLEDCIEEKKQALKEQSSEESKEAS